MFPYEQEPRHLQYVADLKDLNVYSVVNSHKLYGAPTNFTFCIKVSTSENLRGKMLPFERQHRGSDVSLACARRKQLCLVETSGIKCPNVSYLVTCVFKSSISPVRSQDLKMMCAESEQTRKCWTSAFRLFKVFKNDPLSNCLLIIMYIHMHKVKTVCVSVYMSVWEAASV